jgi:2-hydroxy-3-oxopropionate reductase
MSSKIGFVGLGIMGYPMATNLLAAGHEVVAHTRQREVADKLASEHGALAVDSPREVGEQVDVAITMLPDSPQVTEVVTGGGGLLEGLDSGALVIDMSTISPVVAREIADAGHQQGVEMLDAPVSGGDVGAREGTLSIMVGGSGVAFERARPILEVLGKTIVHVGGAGAGQTVKACNQLVVAETIQAVSEAMVLASKAGVDPATMLDVLSAGLAGNKVMEVRRNNFLSHDFTPGFRVDLHLKDMGIVRDTALEYGVALPSAALVTQLMESLRQNGHGAEDHSSLLTVVEGLSNHRIVSGTDEPTADTEGES